MPSAISVCIGATTTLCGPDGNFSYAWTGPNAFTATTKCITVGKGTYNLVVTDLATGCKSDGCSGTITENPKPPCSVTPNATSVCIGGTATLCGPDGNFSYAWTGPNGFTADTKCITVGKGTYNLVVTDLVGG